MRLLSNVINIIIIELILYTYYTYINFAQYVLWFWISIRFVSENHLSALSFIICCLSLKTCPLFLTTTTYYSDFEINWKLTFPSFALNSLYNYYRWSGFNIYDSHPDLAASNNKDQLRKCPFSIFNMHTSKERFWRGISW